MKQRAVKSIALLLILTLILMLGLATATLAEPAAPAELKATVTDGGSVELSWKYSAADAYAFRLYKKLDTDADWIDDAIVVSSGVTTYTDTAVGIGKTYNYKVTAVTVTASGFPPLPVFYESPDSNTVSVFIPLKVIQPKIPALPKPAAPAAPANLSLPPAYEAQPDSVSLVWSDKATDEDGFVIERLMVGAPFPLNFWLTLDEVAADEENYDDSGVLAGTSYQYRVKAYKDHALWGRIFSADSNVLTVTTAKEEETTQPPETPETGEPPASYPGASSWAIAEIDAAVKAGLTTPDILSHFQNSITREEFCEVAVKLYQALSGQTALPIDPNPFNDTANAEILKAYNLGIVQGLGQGKFGPNNNITRQEICLMLQRALKAVTPGADYSAPGVAPFADEAAIAPWAIDAVRYMNKEGIMKGLGEGKIGPLNNTTREHAILLIYRTYEANK